MGGDRIRIGVLALQGGVEEHLRALRSIGRNGGIEAVAVKTADGLEDLDGIILPGGESSAVGKLLSETGLGAELRRRIESGLPVWGTCMGAILLARRIENDDRLHLGVMDISVRRNAYGGQLDSFIERTEVDAPFASEGGPFPMVFIRAPVIESVGPGVAVLARVRGRIVACRQGNMLATTFHPELSDDARFHAFFAETVRSAGLVRA